MIKEFFYLENTQHKGEFYSLYRGITNALGTYVVNLDQGNLLCTPFLFNHLLEGVGFIDSVVFKYIEKQKHYYKQSGKSYENNVD